MTRRAVLAASAGAVLLAGAGRSGAVGGEQAPGAQPKAAPVPQRLPDLAPARWIWYPSARCLANTFVLFRREIKLPAAPRRATGWISADSRYLLRVNGKRVQWGPSPCDPKFLEADPVDVTDFLREGENVIAAQVLFYGHGDGTSPAGKPGFLFRLEVETADGGTQIVVSDQQWQACLPRCWRPGQYKRSFIRALQEEFDARPYPQGWDEPGYTAGADWLEPMVLNNPANEPPITSWFENYLYGYHAERNDAELRARTIPLLREVDVPAAKLSESLWLQWKRPAEEYFECLTPGAFEVQRQPAAQPGGPGEWSVQLEGRRAAVLTFELTEQVVGWPHFTVDAAAGTTVELLVHEAHEVGGPALMNSHWHSWTRLICREGVNRFETFDYESCRWLQLHIRGPAGRVKVSGVGVRRRMFPWPGAAVVNVDEPALRRLINASINTLHNCAQDSCVDGMARERQQYSGDCGHQLHAIYSTFGEMRLPARFITTFSQGMTADGYFMDCWPAFDRMARVMSRAVKLAGWGPILDHGIGFNFDCYHHYLYTADLAALNEAYPRLRRFVEYLGRIRGDNGLLPVENIGIPIVWMDHEAYRSQRHKQCGFNLYAAAMLRHAHAKLCRAFGDDAAARSAETFSDKLLKATIERFWSDRHRLFVDNLPWLKEEGEPRLSDRALATSVLFDQCPNQDTTAAVVAMAEVPSNLGLSYPANACWRYWALVRAGRTEVVVDDLRRRWATMPSVRLNNTLQEDWQVRPDSGSQWSHCAVVPLYIMYMGIAGIRPIEPGFSRCEIRPQPADLKHVHLLARTIKGPISFTLDTPGGSAALERGSVPGVSSVTADGAPGDRRLTLSLPPGCKGELVVSREEDLNLPRIEESTYPGQARYGLEPGKTVQVRLNKT